MSRFSDDDFWDLTRFAEKKPEAEPPGKYKSGQPRIPLVPITDSFRKSERADVYRTAPICREKGDEDCSEYSPKTKPFIISVRLSPSESKSASDFERSAIHFRTLHGREVPFADFYSFSPVYRNLSSEMRDYYLWWRDSFLAGSIIRTTWSYISLYLSELINCEMTEPYAAVCVMWDIFGAYSDVTSELYIADVPTKLPEIICDYSLIHDLPIPETVPEKLLCLAAGNARFREFFFDSGHSAGMTVMLTRFCSEYEYEKSKFASKISVDNAMKYIYGAIVYSSEKARVEKFDHPLAGDFREKTTITRFSYSNMIFVLPKYTCIIKADFCSTNRSYTLRNTVTGIIKQCENRLREHSGIKAKLRVFSLEPFFRSAVDEYLDTALPKVRKFKPEKKKPDPEYEKLYDLPQTEFSLDKAKKIEKKSWSVTERLVDAIGDSPTDAAKADEIPPENEEFNAVNYIEPAIRNENPPTSSVGEELSAIFRVVPECEAFLTAVYRKDYVTLRRESDAVGIPASLIVDRINEAAFDVIGDTLIEEVDGCYEIITDYIQIFDGI